MSIISDSFAANYDYRSVPWGFDGLGYIVYKRTYARRLPDGSRTEEWPETIRRCINGAQKIGAGYTQEEAERLFDHLFNLRCNFAGRMLWQLGTSTVDRFGGNSLLNCWFTKVNKLSAFTFLFENLMLGGGVGFSIRREDVHEIQRVKKGVKVKHIPGAKDTDFIVPDSREGWVRLLTLILEAYFITGKGFTYSTLLIRPEGDPINGFGGTASGPRILVEGMAEICKVLEGRAGKKLRSVDALDICNIVGSIVVAGNVRRSAEIALGDPDDILFLRAKRWDLGNIPNYRAMSNNTIYADEYDHIMENVWDGYGGNGEPYGFFNLPLSQNVGRLGEQYSDNCEGTNPCGEISLADRECCNLSELYLNRLQSFEEMVDCAVLLYKTQKAISALPFLHDETNKVVHKNMRLGLGITGVCQSLHKLSWLDGVYTHLRQFDKEWSENRGWPTSIKLTTIKPSGTLSLLGGATPGVHPAFAPYYIRRVRMSSSDTLVKLVRGAGYHVEFALNFDGTRNHDTVVCEFICAAGDGAILAKNVTAVEQLDLVKQMQTLWSDNAVSVTVYYGPKELDAIKIWLRNNYKNGIKSVSFLRHSEHGFQQAPYEEITLEQYQERRLKVKPVSGVIQAQIIDGLECESGACPIK